MNNQNPPSNDLSRRHFLKNTSLAAGIAAVNLPFIITSHAAPDDPIRVGIIGVGGRGGGAGKDAEKAAPNVKVTAVADIFPEQVERALKNFPEVTPERAFSGWDGYKKLLALPDLTYVILATPPGLRSLHFEAAIAAGRHVFMEKPVAVDPTTVRRMYAGGEAATQKKLCVVAGTQRRHSANYNETIKRIHDGAIGDIIYTKAYWNQGAIWHRGDDGATEMEKQVRNWYHYTWLSGDHIVEQHLHNIDVCNWMMNDHPIKAYGGIGGRHAIGSKSGHIYDHFAVEFEYPNGARMFSQCVQITGHDGNVSEFACGTKGTSNANNWIKAGGETWRSRVQARNPYEQEHADLIAAIRGGQYINETKVVTDSTLTAIMGREATYSGKMVDWETISASKVSLVPEKLEWGPAPKFTVAMPNEHKVD